jgi:hypothetical protein
MSDETEVERLQARIAELETQLSAKEPSPPAGEAVGRHTWRAIGSAVLITLACLLAPVAVASTWASTQLSDTDSYVETVAPLAEDPAVQKAIADDVTATVLEYLDVEQLSEELLTTLAAQENVPPRLSAALPALSVPLTDAVEGFTRTQVENILASEQFANLWEQVNRIAHEQVVTLLEGNEGGAVSAQDDAITLNLGPVIEETKDRLVESGFTLAENIPVVDKQFVLVQSESISSAQSFYQLLNTLGAWLPLTAVVLLVAGVLLARDRRSALLRGALGVTVALLLLGVALAIARTLYVNETPADILTEAAAGNVFDTLVRFLRTGIRAVGVLFLLVALAAFVTGPSSAAMRTRSSLSGGIGSMRGGAESAGFNTGRFGAWTWAHKRALRIATLIVAGVVLVFLDRPTVGDVLVTALVVLVVLAVIEFLARPPAQGEAVATRAPSAETSSAVPPTQRTRENPMVEETREEHAPHG